MPQNTTAIVNQSAFFTCSLPTTSNETHWLRDSDTNYIYAGKKIQRPYKQRFNVTNSSGVSTLIIFPVRTEDAGKYICENGGFDDETFSAFLTVLGSFKNVVTYVKIYSKM